MAELLSEALALAAQGFWVFPLKANGKTPAHNGWQEEATRSPVKIHAMFHNNDFNVGVFTSKFGDDKALLVVDVDNKNGKDGDAEILRLEMEGSDFPNTYTQLTPTGGRHLVYVVDRPVKQGANVVAPGLDIRSRGGYIVGRGSVLTIGTYGGCDHPVSIAPNWLVELCGHSPERERTVTEVSGIDAERASRRALEYLTGMAPPSFEGQGGDQTAYSVACRVKDFGVSEDVALSLMSEHWNDRCSPPWSMDELADKVRNAYAYGTEPIGTAAPEADFTAVETTSDTQSHPFEELNKTYAFIRRGAFVLQENTDEEGRFVTEHLNMAEFHGWFANVPFQAGKKTMPVSQWWTEWTGRRQYEAVVFAPQQDLGQRWYNMWRGFSVSPAAHAKHPAVEAFKEHALRNVCGGDAKLCHWLLGYFAHMVQKPNEKPLVALVFKGKKGTGKNALLDRVGHLLGPHYLVADDDRYLLSNFNSHLEHNLFLVLDEASWAGDKRAEGKLKGLITGSKHNIERKGKESYQVRNLVRVAIIGNEDWLVPATADERRFAVFSVGEGRLQDRKFFANMRTGMEQGGYPHLLRFLLDYDISTVDVNAAPTTEGLMQQKLATLEPFEQWWLDCLTEGRITASEFGNDWPTHIECDRLRIAFGRHLKERNIRTRVPEPRTIGRTLAKLLGKVEKDRGPKSAGQPYRYVLPTLAECRLRWEAFIGHPGDWE